MRIITLDIMKNNWNKFSFFLLKYYNFYEQAFYIYQ